VRPWGFEPQQKAYDLCLPKFSFGCTQPFLFLKEKAQMEGFYATVTSQALSRPAGSRADFR